LNSISVTTLSPAVIGVNIIPVPLSAGGTYSFSTAINQNLTGATQSALNGAYSFWTSWSYDAGVTVSLPSGFNNVAASNMVWYNHFSGSSGYPGTSVIYAGALNRYFASKYGGSTLAYGEVIQIQFPCGVRPSSYSLYGSTGPGNYSTTPEIWILLGSVDGINWSFIDTQTSNNYNTVPWTGTINTTTYSNYYTFLRIVVTESWQNVCSWSKITFSGDINPAINTTVVPKFTSNATTPVIAYYNVSGLTSISTTLNDSYSTYNLTKSGTITSSCPNNVNSVNMIKIGTTSSYLYNSTSVSMNAFIAVVMWPNTATTSANANLFSGSGPSGTTQIFRFSGTNHISTTNDFEYGTGGVVSINGTRYYDYAANGNTWTSYTLTNNYYYIVYAKSGTTSNSICIGTSSNSINSAYIADFICLSSTHTSSAATASSDQTIAEGILAWKWGLTSQLPSNHYYKTTQPSYTINGSYS
jgi:hypothetical protein